MTEHRDSIHVAVVTGSVRPDNFTRKAALLTVDELQRQDNVEVELIEPADLELTFPGVQTANSVAAANRLRESVARASGVVLATPEYHGSVSSVLKCVIENLGFPSVLAGKPVALLGVAAGAIGAIKALEQLRRICSHVGAIVLPGPVSVAGVQQAFAADGTCRDAAVEKRVRGVGTTLLDYLRNSVCPRVNLERMAREGRLGDGAEA
ncbi:MAG: NAD(P)H-dependent oxidoreductase [Planctomycetes bacterium]|nr:NAD(P)H-dependent oxidoreductase [Planctomycetota bacterium]